MSIQCELLERNAQPVLSVRKRAPIQKLPEVLGQTYGVLMQYCDDAGEQMTGAPYVAYYNMDMQDLDLEIGFPVTGRVPGKDDIQSGEIPAGKYAGCVHTGPYNAIESAYNALTEWMKKNEYIPTGVAYEIYLNDPGETPPEKLQTQVLFPLN